MLTAQFNFATGSGGKTSIINALLSTPSFEGKKVVVVSHCREMADQNKRLLPTAQSVTAFELIRKYKRKQFLLEPGTLLIIDSLPAPQVKLLVEEVSWVNILEVWTINQRSHFQCRN